MSLLGQNIPVLLIDLDIIIMQLMGYESAILKLWFGTDIAYKESVATKRLTAPRSAKRNSERKVNNMAVEKAIGSSSLVEVIDRILDKGVVVDAWVRVSLVGIEILAIEARVVVASVETYLKYAEAIGLTATAA